jgi:aquaporin Z
MSEEKTKGYGIPWLLYAAELAGTALLIFVGLSIVIFSFGTGSPALRLVPEGGLRRLIAVSPLGRESGAHINPVVTMGFALMGRMRIRHALGYFVSQMIGAAAGAIPLLAWGAMGKSVEFGATFPGEAYGPGWALAGEIVTTFALIAGLFFFLGNKKLRSFTPLLFPFLYAVMVFLEAPVSGTSTNPARSFGPSLVAGAWNGWWIYWIGPFLGTVAGVILFRWSWLRRLEVEVAKLYHFKHDRYSVFRRDDSRIS